jgi:hypothetical protein
VVVGVGTEEGKEEDPDKEHTRSRRRRGRHRVVVEDVPAVDVAVVEEFVDGAAGKE